MGRIKGPGVFLAQFLRDAEPFSRLDAALRQRFRAFVFERIREQGIPALLVTHDPQDVPAGAQLIELAAEPDDA